MTDSKEQLAQLENYIMKNCLWQFHSRAWDRLKQNAGIIGQTAQILAGEEPVHESALDRCYWVDAVILARAFREQFAWINTLPGDELAALFTALHARIDHLTVHGSLNEELTVPHY